MSKRGINFWIAIIWLSVLSVLAIFISWFGGTLAMLW
jgi:hypothetical protein